MLTTNHKAVLTFVTLYVLGFGYFYVQTFNFEFIAYIGLIIGLFVVIFGTLKYTKFPNYILWGLAIWGLLHMMGGSVQTADGVLYAWRIFPFFDGGGDFYILKFDQVVHAYLYGVVGLMFLHLLRNYFGNMHSQALVAFIAIMAALGVSAVNEIIEFSAVVALPETGVGGYYNTVLDIIFNLFGALVAVSGIYFFRRTARDSC